MKRGYTLRKINWVIPGGRSKRMFLMLGCVSWILMLLCSCGRNLPDSEQVIKRYLKEKYNQEFQIVHTERKNIGQNFGEFINTGEAVSLNESDDAFSLYRKFLKSSEIVYNRLEIKNDITKERRGLRHDVVYEVFCFGLG